MPNASRSCSITERQLVPSILFTISMRQRPRALAYSIMRVVLNSMPVWPFTTIATVSTAASAVSVGPRKSG